LPAQGELKRQLGLTAAAAVVVGEVIGVGIFLYPAGMAKSLGSPMWLLIVWLMMGAMALCGALCYGELASRFPQAGGGYVYLREAYGSQMAFLYGWMALLVLDPGLTALFAVGAADNAGRIIHLSPLGVKAIGIGAILLLAAVNILGVKLGSRVMQALTVLKLGLLAFIIIWGFGFAGGSWANFLPFAERHSTDTLTGALAGAVVVGFFSFAGWWDVTKIAGEVREPARTLPRALSFGILIITVVYIMTSAVFLYLVPTSRVPAGDEAAVTFAAQVGNALFASAGGQVFAGIVVICVLGSLTAFMMAAPRVYYAMARDDLFIKSIAAVHTRFGTPARAIILQALLASLLLAIGTFEQILAYFFFVTVLFIALTVAAIFRLHRRQADASTYRTPGYPLTPLFFLMLVAVLLFLLAARNPMQAFLGVVVVALGSPVYYLLFRRKAVSRH
jgi:APA family basic amino acid/polyamine antiporter